MVNNFVISFFFSVSLEPGLPLLPPQSLFGVAGAEMFWPIKPDIARTVGLEPFGPPPTSL